MDDDKHTTCPRRMVSHTGGLQCWHSVQTNTNPNISIKPMNAVKYNKILQTLHSNLTPTVPVS